MLRAAFQYSPTKVGGEAKCVFLGIWGGQANCGCNRTLYSTEFANFKGREVVREPNLKLQRPSMLQTAAAMFSSDRRWMAAWNAGGSAWARS